MKYNRSRTENAKMKVQTQRRNRDASEKEHLTLVLTSVCKSGTQARDETIVCEDKSERSGENKLCCPG